MKPDLFEFRYYQTYFIANMVNNILADPINYIRSLNDFYGDEQYVRFLKPYQRHSAFHQFIEYIVHSDVFESLEVLDLVKMKKNIRRFEGIPSNHRDLRSLPIDDAMQYQKIEHEPFADWLQSLGKSFEDADENDAYDFYMSLMGTESYGLLLEKTIEGVFFIMFLNRNVLLNFHSLVSGAITDAKTNEVDCENQKWFAKDGVLRRQAIPKWAQKAVFFRDRGRCVFCNRDLSHLLSLQNEENFDHLVPLARGGLNDVTNLQLLCADCNRKKSDGVPATSVFYEKWY